MSYFMDAEEAYRYLGGVFRAADEHLEVGQALRASGITLRLEYTNPSATLTVRMVEPHIEVIEGETDIQPDVRLSMAADTATSTGAASTTSPSASPRARSRPRVPSRRSSRWCR